MANNYEEGAAIENKFYLKPKKDSPREQWKSIDIIALNAHGGHGKQFIGKAPFDFKVNNVLYRKGDIIIFNNQYPEYKVNKVTSPKNYKRKEVQYRTIMNLQLGRYLTKGHDQRWYILADNSTGYDRFGYQNVLKNGVWKKTKTVYSEGELFDNVPEDIKQLLNEGEDYNQKWKATYGRAYKDVPRLTSVGAAKVTKYISDLVNNGDTSSTNTTTGSTTDTTSTTTSDSSTTSTGIDTTGSSSTSATTSSTSFDFIDDILGTKSTDTEKGNTDYDPNEVANNTVSNSSLSKIRKDTVNELVLAYSKAMQGILDNYGNKDMYNQYSRDSI